MDCRAVTSSGVVKISRLALRLRRSARRGLEPTAGKHVLSCPVLWHLGDLSTKTSRYSRVAPNDLSAKTLRYSRVALNDLSAKTLRYSRAAPNDLSAKTLRYSRGAPNDLLDV